MYVIPPPLRGARSLALGFLHENAEMTYKVVEYCEEDLAGVLAGMSSLSLATGPHRRRDKAAAAPAHVFVVDGNMRDDALVDLARSVEEVRRRYVCLSLCIYVSIDYRCTSRSPCVFVAAACFFVCFVCVFNC